MTEDQLELWPYRHYRQKRIFEQQGVIADTLEGLPYVLADADSHISSSDGVNVIRMPEHYGELSPMLHVVPLQLLAYHTACARGTDVDKPRNLAKSVTVE